MTWVSWGRRWWMRRICGGRRSSSARVVGAGVVAAAVDTGLQPATQAISCPQDASWGTGNDFACCLAAGWRQAGRHDLIPHGRSVAMLTDPAGAAGLTAAETGPPSPAACAPAQLDHAILPSSTWWDPSALTGRRRAIPPRAVCRAPPILLVGWTGLLGQCGAGHVGAARHLLSSETVGDRLTRRSLVVLLRSESEAPVHERRP
jgi:hypothetical protein